MSEKNGARVIDQGLHYRNRAKFTLRDLRPYAGEIVAWSFEGDRIVAHSKDALEVDRQVIAQGINPEEVVYEGMPPPEYFEGLD
jgi:hypothetical protein